MARRHCRDGRGDIDETLNRWAEHFLAKAQVRTPKAWLSWLSTLDSQQDLRAFKHEPTEEEFAAEVERKRLARLADRGTCTPLEVRDFSQEPA